MHIPRRSRAALVLVLCSLAALPAFAQKFRPGLWEVSSNVDGTTGRMQQALAQLEKTLATLPPDERKAYEDAMAEQGVKPGGNSLSAQNMKVCITREMATKYEAMFQQQGDCSTKSTPAAGGVVRISATCTKPPVRGEGEMHFDGDTGYRLKMKMTSLASGTPDGLKVDATGKWLGTDCGNVQPPQ